MRKRGRPKGAEKTVIGLPRKKSRGSKPVAFLNKPPEDKEKGQSWSSHSLLHDYITVYPHAVILLWFLKPQIANAALAGNIVQQQELNLTSELVPASILDDNVCIESCRKYFSHNAWAAIQRVVDEVRNHPVWYCGRCKLPIHDEEESSIMCNCCLCWFHFTCMSFERAPKSKTWFCRSCYTLS